MKACNDFEHINRIYGINAKLNMQVSIDGKKGHIKGVSTGSMYLMVQFEGEGFFTLCHPTWRVTYYKNCLGILREVEKSKIQKGGNEE